MEADSAELSGASRDVDRGIQEEAGCGTAQAWPVRLGSERSLDEGLRGGHRAGRGRSQRGGLLGSLCLSRGDQRSPDQGSDGRDGDLRLQAHEVPVDALAHRQRSRVRGGFRSARVADGLSQGAALRLDDEQQQDQAGRDSHHRLAGDWLGLLVGQRLLAATDSAQATDVAVRCLWQRDACRANHQRPDFRPWGAIRSGVLGQQLTISPRKKT